MTFQLSVMSNQAISISLTLTLCLEVQFHKNLRFIFAQNLKNNASFSMKKEHE